MQIPVDNNLITTLCNREDINYLGLFGSQARGEATVTSDIDLLIDFNKTKSFFELAKIKDQLEKVFGKEVDLVLRSNIKTQLKPYILKDVITLYGKS